MKKRKIGKYLFFFTFIYGLFYLLENLTKAEGSSHVNIYEKLAGSDDITYLVIGDSIGRGSGASAKSEAWFSKLDKHLKDVYGSKAKRHSIVQSGSTAFEGLYKLQQAKDFGHIDVIFIVFGENDRKYMDEKQFAQFYEALIRKAKKLYPDSEIMTVTESCLDDERFAGTIKTISNHYGAKNTDMRKPFAESGKTAGMLTVDMVHPNDEGYTIYADSLFKTIRQLVDQKAAVASLPAPLHPNADFLMAANPNYVEMSGNFAEEGGYLSSDEKNASLKFGFTGPFLGVNVIGSERGGKMDVYVDGQFVRTVSTWWPLLKQRNYYIVSGLEDGPHQVEFIVKDEASERSLSGETLIQLSSIIFQKADS